MKMLLIIHNNKIILRVKNLATLEEISPPSIALPQALIILAESFTDHFLVWCDTEFEKYLVQDKLSEVFHHNRVMASYAIKKRYLPSAIGYVELSPFIRINTKVSYPTWQMSTDVGGVYAGVLLKYKEAKFGKSDFAAFLNHISKLGQPLGLLCYSEPALVKTSFRISPGATGNLKDLFAFVQNHYSKKWLFLLSFNLLIYENRLKLRVLIRELMRKKDAFEISLEDIEVRSSREVIHNGSIDVVIPTLGRMQYLKDVLFDLKKQTRLPDKVIIIEQNADPESNTELDFIHKEEWPFKIEHLFIHRTGVCNARNLGMRNCESEWVFFNDDDNQIPQDFLSAVFENIRKFGNEACTVAYLKPKEKNDYDKISQTTIFGSGNSVVKRKNIADLSFSESLEFGYGEDKDFGMQLRNSGTDIIYFPRPSIVHLKVPFGGFREKIKFPWDSAKIPPKPSPTLMWYNLKYLSKEQLRNYKSFLFLTTLKKGDLRGLFQFRSRWKQSVHWAQKL